MSHVSGEVITIVDKVLLCSSRMEMHDKAELKKNNNFAQLKKLQVSLCNSQTERQEDAKELEITTNSDELKKPLVTAVFNASDIRHQKLGDRIVLLANLRRALPKLETDNSGRAKAKRNSTLHKITILSK